MPEGGHNFGTSVEAGGLEPEQFASDHEQVDMPGLIRSGSSSPKTLDMAEGPPLSPGDKKRSKLGYHRTAVACGHCRRRKIRCIPAFDDPGGRCQNCIRLKKDCHFFPVDQPNSAPGKRLRSATKTSEGFLNEGDTSVASSSPGGIFRSTSTEHMNHAEGPLDTPPLAGESPGFHGFNQSRSMSVQGLDFPHTYNTGQQQPQQTMLQSPYSPRGYVGGQLNAQYYHQPYGGHSLPSHYSSAFPTGSLPASMTNLGQEHTFDYTTSTSNGSYHWNQPTRSISTDVSEELPSGFPAPYRTNTYPSFERRMTGQMQQFPSTSSSMMPVGIESQQNAAHGNFGEPTAYDSMSMGMHHDWVGAGPDSAHMGTPSGRGSYTQVWHQPHPPMNDMGQAEPQPQILPSNSRSSKGRQHKPG